MLLEDPRHFGNLGAVIRVAAAAEAAGVLTTGRQDPWDPVAVRGSAGLHFALPVARLEHLPGDRQAAPGAGPRGRRAAPGGGAAACAAGVRNRARRSQRAFARTCRCPPAPADASRRFQPEPRYVGCRSALQPASGAVVGLQNQPCPPRARGASWCALNNCSVSLGGHVRRQLAPCDRELVHLVGAVGQAQGAQVRVGPGERKVV